MREIHESVPQQGVNENLNRPQYHTQTKCAKEAQQNGGEQEQDILSWIIQGQWGTKTEQKNNRPLLFHSVVWDLIYPKGSR